MGLINMNTTINIVDPKELEMLGVNEICSKCKKQTIRGEDLCIRDNQVAHYPNCSKSIKANEELVELGLPFPANGLRKVLPTKLAFLKLYPR